jgi:multidrug efflux pump subunit AcrA (membrane-fusion protein)
MDYELTVPCSVVPAQLRHVTVPFDGVLLSATALQGDRVRKGDALCEMDHRELDQQRAELLAEIAVLEHEKDRAMAESTPVELQLALARQRLARAKLDIVNARLEQACVRSPIDGVIASGDLRKRVGAVVTRGEPLFEVAPLDRTIKGSSAWLLELQVPEAEADELPHQCGSVINQWSPSGAGRTSPVLYLTGSFAPHARPEESQAFRIKRVRPQAEVHDQKNVIVAEAEIDLPYAWMRPGMEGVARVNVGRRPVWWVALHGAIEYVQLHLWP